MSAHLGEWEIVYDGENPLDTQQTAVHACLIYNPNSNKWKVLYFRASNPPTDTPLVETKIWNPDDTTNPISTQQIPDWPSWNSPPDPVLPPDDLHGRLFCSGHCFLADGNLLVAGGHRTVPAGHPWARGMLFSYIFNPVNETWNYERISPNHVRMQDGRWYPTTTLLADRTVVVSGGFRYNYSPVHDPTLVFNNDIEIYDPAVPSWTYLGPTANNPYIANYPGVHVIPYGNFAGELFYSIPVQESYRFNPEGPSWNTVASSSLYRTHGCSVLLPLLPGQTSVRIMIIGGLENEDVNATKTCEIINLNDGTPSWSATGDMANGRNNANAVILPDGKVLVVGGNLKGGYTGPVYMSEVYDPATGLWSTLVSQQYQRKYHSTALLLPDGRVWSAGSEDTAGGSNFTNLEIYSPGYLFEGARPQFYTPPPSNISYGATFSINTDVPIDSAVLIKPGSTTHAFDQDQRFVGLNLGPAIINGGYTYEATAPANGNIAPPGYYMLFVVRPKSASSSGQHKIPSIAKFVKLS